MFGPGDVAHVYPPDRDVHRIYNRTETPTVSIHIYGGDIGTQQRHVFELPSGRIKPFVSGYDQPLPDCEPRERERKEIHRKGAKAPRSLVFSEHDVGFAKQNKALCAFAVKNPLSQRSMA